MKRELDLPAQARQLRWDLHRQFTSDERETVRSGLRRGDDLGFMRVLRQQKRSREEFRRLEQWNGKR